jgi:hypothetical protein
MKTSFEILFVVAQSARGVALFAGDDRVDI